MSRDEHWRWFRLVVAFILWTTLCGIAGSFLLQKAKGAPVPFAYQNLAGVYQVGEGYLYLSDCGKAAWTRERVAWTEAPGWATGRWSVCYGSVRLEFPDGSGTVVYYYSPRSLRRIKLK